MSRRMRTYYYALLGAMRGLIGWQVSDRIGLSFSSNLYLSEAVVGALVGLCVGLFIGLTEGALTRNPVQAIKSGVFSGLLGSAAGAIGLPLSEFLFQSVGALLRMQAVGGELLSASSAAEVVQISVNRILSICAVHEILSQRVSVSST